jgi:hypothetical protein
VFAGWALAAALLVALAGAAGPQLLGRPRVCATQVRAAAG